VLELAGITRENLEVTASATRLKVRGDRPAAEFYAKAYHHCVERPHGRFERIIPLPARISPDYIETDFNVGVLTIKMPKES
jgi:HSP20 family protein